MEQKVTYIHYGADEFVPYIPKIRNLKGFPKPAGGLWGSRENDPLGWKMFCESEHFNKGSLRHFFRFRLAPDTKVLILNKEEQLKDLPKLKPWEPKDCSELLNLPPDQMPTREQLDYWFKPNPCFLDFEKIAKEYDALEVTSYGALSEPLHGWDCNSIVVFRPEVVEIV